MGGIPYEKIVAEDLNLGTGTATVTMPGGGTALGTQINLGTFQDSVGVLVSALPAAAAGKGQLRWVQDALAVTPGSTVTGGGTNYALVASNGVNWVVVTG